MFQKRHFEAIADEVMTWDFLNCTPEKSRIMIVSYLCNFFQHHNPNFKRNTFIKRCETWEGEFENIKEDLADFFGINN